MYKSEPRCIVHLCENNFRNNPEKLFIPMPREEDIRNKWLELSGRTVKELPKKRNMSVCEDHFNLPIDMENYMEFKIMGSVKRVKMKKGCVPSKFGFKGCLPRADEYVKGVDFETAQAITSVETHNVEDTGSSLSQEKLTEPSTSKSVQLQIQNFINKSTQCIMKFKSTAVSPIVSVNIWNMEVFENTENKGPNISSVDFPFICRICLLRGDLRLFEGEDYLLDLFETITKIDVCSTASFPKNICNECVNKLEDLSLFIDISKYNDARQGDNLTRKTTEEHEDIYSEGSDICRICSSTGCLTPFEEKPTLMQLFQNITSIDVKSESNSSSRNNICIKCIKELEKISIFISSSLCNDMILKNSNGICETLETKDCSEENTTNVNSSKCCDMKFKNVLEENEVEMDDFHTIIDLTVEQTDRNRLVTSKKPKCDCCKNTFSMKSQSHKHNMLTHTGQKQFICDICKKRFTSKHNLKEHLKTHNGEKPFVCDICKSRFTRKQTLKLHSLTHTGEMPFVCAICKKRFTRKQTLMLHSLTHTEEKPFVCDICKKRFTRKMTLKCHLLSHTGENVG